jgi:hypothetical protein
MPERANIHQLGPPSSQQQAGLPGTYYDKRNWNGFSRMSLATIDQPNER